MHTHYGTIKVFKGKLADGEQEQIPLLGGKSGTGYRIVKFELMPGVLTSDIISIIKINKLSTAATSTIDFNDQILLAAGVIRVGNLISETHTSITMFDREVFNQDIYINCKNLDANVDINYYLELEEVKMTGPQEAVVNFSAVILNTS